MVIFKGLLLGVALFVIGSLVYLLAAQLIWPGLGVIRTSSPYLWLAFVGSLALGCLISIRGLWVFQGVILGLVMFIAEVVAFWIVYARSLNAVGIDVLHLLPWLIVALICSVGLGLTIVRIWPTKGIPVP